MKKLLIYDHMGNKVFERDVYLEGADFRHEQDLPSPIWLQKLLIVDQEPEPAEMLPPEPEPQREILALPLTSAEEGHLDTKEATAEAACPFARVRSYPDCFEDCPDTTKCPVSLKAPEDKKPDFFVWCTECDWQGSTKDCDFGHNEFCCPRCYKESLEDVITEAETQEIEEAIAAEAVPEVATVEAERIADREKRRQNRKAKKEAKRELKKNAHKSH